MRHYSAGHETVARWLDETGLAPAKPARKRVYLRPAPDGYRSQRLAMTQKAAAAYFEVGQKVIRRWDHQHDIPIDMIRLTAVDAAKSRRPSPGSGKRNAYMTHPVDRAHVDVSTAGRAADHLRRLGAVYRCKPSGAADPKGTHWRRGNAVLTDDELIQRAERQGFIADAWKAAA